MTDTIVQPILEVTVVSEDSQTHVTAEEQVNLVVVQQDDSIVVYEQEVPVLIEVGGIQGPPGAQGPTGPPGPSGGEEVPLAKQVDFNATGDQAYIGEALPGTATNVAQWRIKFIQIASDDDVAVTWASGNDTFDKIWDNRASYSYS